MYNELYCAQDKRKQRLTGEKLTAPGGGRQHSQKFPSASRMDSSGMLRVFFSPMSNLSSAVLLLLIGNA